MIVNNIEEEGKFMKDYEIQNLKGLNLDNNFTIQSWKIVLHLESRPKRLISFVYFFLGGFLNLILENEFFLLIKFNLEHLI